MKPGLVQIFLLLGTTLVTLLQSRNQVIKNILKRPDHGSLLTTGTSVNTTANTTTTGWNNTHNTPPDHSSKAMEMMVKQLAATNAKMDGMAQEIAALKMVSAAGAGGPSAPPMSSQPPTMPPPPPQVEVKVTTHHHHDYPEPKDNPYYNKLVSLGLERSQKQFRKFLFQKNKNLTSVFDKRTRFHFGRDSAAMMTSKQWAFLHIYKNGGTTVEFMRPRREKQHPLNHHPIKRRKWFTVVRDPIDRFLSAWAECGYRQKKGMDGYGSLGKLIEKNYDLRIRAFLRATNRTIGGRGGCARHAYPQANFMMKPGGTIDEHVKVVGDLSELKHMVLDIGGFRYWNDTKRSNGAAENLYKAKYYPSNRSLLSDDTILELCQFLQLDYYLFDFDPPSICIANGGPLEFLN